MNDGLAYVGAVNPLHHGDRCRKLPAVMKTAGMAKTVSVSNILPFVPACRRIETGREEIGNLKAPWRSTIRANRLGWRIKQTERD